MKASMTVTFADLIASTPTPTYADQVAAAGFDPLAERDERRAEAEVQALALAAALAEDEPTEDENVEGDATEDTVDEETEPETDAPVAEADTDESTPCDETRALVRDYIAAVPENPQPHDSI
jgi:hypothetical protein